MSASGVLRSPLHSAAHNITYELLHRFVMGDTPQSDIPSALSSIFNAQDYKWTIEQLREQDLRMWVDGLDQVYRPRNFLRYQDLSPSCRS